MTNEMLEMKAQQKEAIEARIAELKAEATAIELEIKSELDSRKVDSIETPLYKFFWKLTESNTIDQKKLKAEYPEVVSNCMTKQTKNIFQDQPKQIISTV